jgi:hypothetical protein
MEVSIADFIKWLIDLFRTVKLTIAIQGGGTTLPTAGDHVYLGHPTVHIYAYPKQGWRFSHWEGGLTGSENPGVVKMSENLVVTAVFVQEEYQVVATVVPGEGGSIGRDNPGPYYYGSQVVLTANANAGWKFVGWSGSVNSTAPTINLIVNGNINVVATFQQLTYTLTVNIIGQGSVAKQPDKSTYTAGEYVQLTGTPVAGSKFDHYEYKGQQITQNPANIQIG